MKKACRYHCEICEVNFETLDRFSVHLASRGHLICKLQNNPADGICLDKEDDIALSNDAESTEVFPEIVLDVQDTSHFLESEEESSIAREIDPFSDVENIITDVGADSDEEIFNMTQQRINDYFPFPSEIFFLLYSYTHNISRPKVFLRCYIIIYGKKI